MLPSNEKEAVYEIHIDNFDGPLDLLWDLIKKAKIDVTDVSISDITEQYISYLKHMKTLSVKIASEFIWMASELLYYKSKALLPTEDLGDEFFVPPLPPELIEKLLEYKKYQKASIELKEMFDMQDRYFMRDAAYKNLAGENDSYIDVSLFDLLKAFAGILETQEPIEREEIIFDEILVSDRIDYIIGLLKEKEIVVFSEIFSRVPVRAEVIASFLAVLEMTKTGMIRLDQHRVFGEIRVIRRFSLDSVS